MTDIIVTLPKEEEMWAPTSEEEIRENWDSWDIESILPKRFYQKDKVWIYHRGYIKAYCTVDRLEYNMEFPKDSTLLMIWFKSLHLLENPVNPKYKIRRSFEYTKRDWRLGE